MNSSFSVYWYFLSCSLYCIFSRLNFGHIQEGLTPSHLKKAKLMFFYTRYPSSSVLKTYFPDVKVRHFTESTGYMRRPVICIQISIASNTSTWWELPIYLQLVVYGEER